MPRKGRLSDAQKRAGDAERKAAVRAGETEGESKARRATNAVREAARRAVEDEAERQARRSCSLLKVGGVYTNWGGGGGSIWE